MNQSDKDYSQAALDFLSPQENPMIKIKLNYFYSRLQNTNAYRWAIDARNSLLSDWA
jgi:hypothetical protein